MAEGMIGISAESGVIKGAWSPEEDNVLISSIAVHGEGRWNHLARTSGLKRTGKSCRMRWKNYLHPDVRRGNFTPLEKLWIIELHCLYGNRWSKIAEFLPGRTDNEIKNYWRTRVQKQAKQLNYNINSTEFVEFIREIWAPRLSEQAHYFNFNNNPDTNSDGLEAAISGPILMDSYCTGTLSLQAQEAHQVAVTDNLREGDWAFITSGLDFGQDCTNSPLVHEYPAWFTSGKLMSDYDM